MSDEMVLGELGAGWHQVTSELAFERSGPERFLSTFPLLTALIGELSGAADSLGAAGLRELGSLVSRVWTLRRLSLGIAASLSSGLPADVPAALVKDLGTRYENEVIDAARLLVSIPPDPGAEPASFARLLAESVLHAPGFTLRGGTNEILRGVVARGLGLR